MFLLQVSLILLAARPIVPTGPKAPPISTALGLGVRVLEPIAATFDVGSVPAHFPIVLVMPAARPALRSAGRPRVSLASPCPLGPLLKSDRSSSSSSSMSKMLATSSSSAESSTLAWLRGGLWGWSEQRQQQQQQQRFFVLTHQTLEASRNQVEYQEPDAPPPPADQFPPWPWLVLGIHPLLPGPPPTPPLPDTFPDDSPGGGPRGVFDALLPVGPPEPVPRPAPHTSAAAPVTPLSDQVFLDGPPSLPIPPDPVADE
uniref:Secreted protein n=1 Tax=Anopheles coluzzii TaxID=1518534 RepID=A0A8W7PFR1_ANOCL